MIFISISIQEKRQFFFKKTEGENRQLNRKYRKE